MAGQESVTIKASAVLAFTLLLLTVCSQRSALSLLCHESDEQRDKTEQVSVVHNSHAHDVSVRPSNSLLPNRQERIYCLSIVLLKMFFEGN